MDWNVFANWSWPTAIVTGLALPVLTVIGLAVRKALVKWTRYAVDGALYVVGKYLTHQVASAVTLRQYATRQLAGPSGELLVPAREDIALKTDRAYVPLTFEGPLAEKRYDHTTIALCGNRIRVIGEPGSGKTTVLKRILRDECRRALRSARSARFPVLFELKYVNPPADVPAVDLGDWFLNFIKSDLVKTEVFNMAQCIDSYLSHGGILLLLDGADEISSSNFSRAIAAITQLSLRLQQLSDNNMIIMTMRTQFHQLTRSSFAETFPHVLEAKPFSPSDIYRFLSVWPFKENPQVQVARIHADLIDRPNLRDMCTNPLVLSMYVAEDQLTGHPLVPESRTDFYARVAEELLIRRRASQVGAPAGVLKIREDRAKVLGRLALEHLLDEKQAPNLLRWTDGVRIASEVYACDQLQAEERLREVAVSTGLVSEERPGESLRFIHLTFCEFFAAQHAIRGRRMGWRELIRAYQKFSCLRSSVASTRLDQVIPFAAGLSPSYHSKEDALSDVRELGNARVTGLCFLETKLYDHEEWIEYCIERMAYLLSTLDQEPQESWLRELHLFAVVSRDFMTTASANPEAYRALQQRVDVDAFFRRLGDAGEVGLRRILRAYGSRDPGAAFRIAALCKYDVVAKLPELIIESRDDPAVLAVAIESLREDKGNLLRWASLLTECVFKSEVAAETISKIASTRAWVAAVEDVEPEKRWDLFLGNRGLLSDALTVFFMDAECLRQIEDGKLGRMCQEFPSPGLLSREGRRLRFLSVSALIASFGMLVLGFQMRETTFGQGFVVGAYIMMAAGIIMWTDVRMHRYFTLWLLGTGRWFVFKTSCAPATRVSRGESFGSWNYLHDRWDGGDGTK
jgi:NACHT domain